MEGDINEIEIRNDIIENGKTRRTLYIVWVGLYYAKIYEEPDKLP